MRALHLVALTAISLLSLSSQCGKEEPTPAPPPPAQPQSPPPPPVTPPPACVHTIAFTQVAGWRANPDCIAEPVPITGIGASKTYVINSPQEYGALVQCAAAPVIDFAVYTLLIGKMKTPYADFLLSQKVEQTCSGSYTYSVRVGGGGATMPSQVSYYALVPKLPANAQVDFDVQYVR